MEIVKLKTGVEVPEPLLRVAMLTLNDLLTRGEGILFYELVMKARNRDHRFFGNARARLQDLAFLDHSGDVHGSIRDVILAAVSGEGIDMILGSPVAAGEPA